MTTIEYPEMRAEVVAALMWFADPQHQRVR
jgi:hypothetical protein